MDPVEQKYKTWVYTVCISSFPFRVNAFTSFTPIGQYCQEYADRLWERHQYYGNPDNWSSTQK
jgi:hypothetical protein